MKKVLEMKINKKKFEQYKKIMRFLGGAIIVASVTMIFLWFWKENYNEGIVFPFYSKGHWLMEAFYVFFLILFLYIYGGMSYGYLKNTNIVFSQGLSLVCANVVIYLEIVLLSAKFVNVVPMLKMTVLQFVVIVIWSSAWGKLFKIMFPPHKVTVLYQNYDPSQMLNKVKTRKDRYRIKDTVNVYMPWENIILFIVKL